MNNRKANNHGFSLVELMISMTLGLILVSGVIAVFSGSKRTSELTSAMANMQENARFALHAITSDLRSAGFQGCLSVSEGINDITNAQILGPNGMFFTAATGSVVVNAPVGEWTPAPIGNFQMPNGIEAVPGTHTISMRGGSANRIALGAPMFDGAWPDASLPLVLDPAAPPTDGRPGSPMIVSDCSVANLFIMSALSTSGASQVVHHDATVNVQASFNQPYGNFGTLGQVSVTPYLQNLYFVGTTGQTTENGDPIRALYKQSWPFNPATNPPVEIIQGIENLRVSYGLQDSQGRVRYVLANDATFDGSQVVSVQIGILMTSWDRIANVDDNKTYMLAGQPVLASKNAQDGTAHAEDRRYRLAFNTTVKVRNRRMESQ